MEAGRELDALVAEHVMGYECVCSDEPVDCPVHYAEDLDTLLPYSTDIAAAWPVVERMRELRWVFSLCTLNAGDFYCIFKVHEFSSRPSAIHDARADTAPHAICLAALRAVGVEVP